MVALETPARLAIRSIDSWSRPEAASSSSTASITRGSTVGSGGFPCLAMACLLPLDRTRHGIAPAADRTRLPCLRTLYETV